MKGPRIAIIGAGQMGSAAARRLARLGYDLILWNRTRSKAEELAKSIGARSSGSLEEAVGQAEYALVFLLDDDALAWLAASMPRNDGLILVNHSTNTPRMSMLASTRLKGLGVCYVEAPIIGGPTALEDGRAKLLVAGEERCISRASPVLRGLAGSIIVLGRVGSAMAAKLSYNLLLMASLMSMGESVLLSQAHGIDLDTLRSVMEGTPLEGLTVYLERVVGLEDPGGARIHIAAKDLAHADRALYEAGLPSPVTSATSNVYRLALLHGCRDLYYAATARILGGCRDMD